MKPQVIIPSDGFHNANLDLSRTRLIRGGSYRDLSTVCVIVTRGMIPVRVLQSWFNLLPAMNQKFVRIFIAGMEVGDGYNAAMETVLANPELQKWKYILTLEEDNLPPPDGLLKLYESIEGGVDGKKYDAVGGLYWTKGPSGQPMIYGAPDAMPRNFIPQTPRLECVHPCNGLGMGFTLFRISMFKDPMLERPFFKTLQEYQPCVGTRVYTQDLAFFEKAGSIGRKFACDTRVKVGHFSIEEDLVW